MSQRCLNILHIVADQHHANMLGCVDRPVITPHTDRLTTDGVDLSPLLRGTTASVKDVAVTEWPWSKALRWKKPFALAADGREPNTKGPRARLRACGMRW